jgi:glycosyltransferase involved in cell wall biosynthesis
MQMSKILIYLHSFEGGGAERNSALLANEFARRGHRVLIAVDKIAGPNRELLSKLVEVRHLDSDSHMGDISVLRKVVKKFRPDIQYAHVGLSPIKVLIATLGIFTWKKIVISYHSSYDARARPGGRMTYKLAAFLTRMAGSTIAVSKDVRNELVHKFWASKNRIRVVHNPVDIEWIELQASEAKPRWLNGRKYILSAGRLIHQKDYPTLLRAFSKIQSKIDHDLVILGEGPLRQSLEALINELELSTRVHMPGYLRNPFPIYRHADLFVLSSVFEGFGNVIVEALSLGIPVVATHCPGGPKEILDGGRYGSLVSVGDTDKLAQAIECTLKNPIESQILKKRAKYFSVDRIASIYLDIVTGS